jgi:hypothetical protein
MLDVHTPVGLMPDTADLNFYTADPDLAFLLRQHLSEDEYEQARRLTTHGRTGCDRRPPGTDAGAVR